MHLLGQSQILGQDLSLLEGVVGEAGEVEIWYRLAGVRLDREENVLANGLPGNM